MNKCEKTQNVIMEHYLNRQNLPENIQNHIISCTSCTEYANDMNKLFESLKSCPVPEPSDVLISNTLKKIEQISIRANKNTVLWKIVLAAVACFPIVFAVNLFWVTVIPDLISIIFPTLALIVKYTTIPVSLLGMSLIYGSIPLIVGKYFALERGCEYE